MTEEVLAPSSTDPEPALEPEPELDSHAGAISDLFLEVIDELEAVNTRDRVTIYNHLRGVQTGFRELDAATGGLLAGTLTVLVSRPAMGRTTLLTDFCRHAAIKNGLPTLLYSLQESPTSMAIRVKSAEAAVLRHHFIGGSLTEEDWTRLTRVTSRIADAPLYIRSSKAPNLTPLHLDAAEAVEELGIKLIAVDGIDELRPTRHEDRAREVRELAQGLKDLARALNVPVVATVPIAAPSGRPAKDWYTNLQTLPDFDAFGFTADNVIMLHRDDAYEKGSPRAGEADLHLVKTRNGGAPGVFVIGHQGHYSRFSDFAQP